MATTPWHLLTQTMEIYAGTWTTGADGVPQASFSATAVSVKCNVQPLSAGDALAYGRDTTTKVYDVFCAPVNTAGAAWTCTPKDRILIGGVRYRATGQPRDLISMGTVLVLGIERDVD